MDSRLTTFNKQRTAWREMERNGLLALLSREGVIISVSIYTTFLATFFTLGSNRVHRFTTQIGVVLLKP